MPTFLIEIQADDKTWFAAIDNSGAPIKTKSAIKADKEITKLRARGFKVRARVPQWEGQF